MALIAYPGEARHQEVSLQPIASAFVNRSQLSHTRQAHDLGYSWWEAQVTVAQMSFEDAREWRLFLGRLRGPVNTFRVPILAGQQHAGGYVVQAMGAGSGYSLSTDGWPASSTPLQAGDYVTVGAQLMMLDADAATDGLGRTTLQFHAPLRGIVVDNTPIETKNPFLTAALPDNSPALTLSLGQIQAGFSFSAVEAY